MVGNSDDGANGSDDNDDDDDDEEDDNDENEMAGAPNIEFCRETAGETANGVSN